jgi:uncharacterized protein YegL
MNRTFSVVTFWLLAICFFEFVRSQYQTMSSGGLRIVDEKPFFDISDDYVPLKSVDVQAHIVDFLAKVTVIQTFVNNRNNPIECVYTFPLDESAAVTEFIAEIDGRTVVAKAKPKDEALRDYREGIERGHTTFLAAEERADIFTINIGNLGPGKAVEIKLTYLTELALEGEALRFILPTTIAPRYVPPQDSVTKDGRPTSIVLNPPAVDKVPYRLSMTLKLNMPSKIKKISSSTHPLEVSIEETKATVTLGTGVTELNSDIIVIVTLHEPHKPRLWIETMEGETTKAMMLILYPDLEKKLEAPPKRQQLIFVVDVSGSMEGEKIAFVRDALIISLEELMRRSRKVIEKFGETNYYFNIYTFSNQYANLFAECVPATEANVKRALEFVKKLEAHGGTELLYPLKHILESDQEQNILLLTDGEISNTDEVITLTYEKRHHARVFTLGIGYGVSHHLVNGLARAGAGVSEFAIPGEQLKEKVLRQLQRALNSNSQKILTIQWPSKPKNDTAQLHRNSFSTPYELPILYENSRLIAYLVAEGDISGDLKVVTLGGPDYIISSHDFKYLVGDTVHKLAARSRIRDLEEGRSEYHQKKENDRLPQNVEDVDRVKQEIIQIALKYNLLSRETSFVAVDTSQTSDASKMVFRRIEIQKVKDFLSQSRTKYAFATAYPHYQPMATLLTRNRGFIGQNENIVQKVSSAQKETPFLLNVTPLSIGAVNAHGYFVPIILRNTPIPTQKSFNFTTSKDNQTAVTINLYEGESIFAKNNMFLGKLRLSGLQPLPVGQTLITVSIVVDVSSDVTVSATQSGDVSPRLPESITLTLSKMDEDAIMDHVQQHWDEPKLDITTPQPLPE